LQFLQAADFAGGVAREQKKIWDPVNQRNLLL